MLENFRLSKYKLILKAKEPMFLPEYKGSMFRGGFGYTLRHICCSSKEGNCKECLLKEKCPYAYIFETSPPAEVKHFGRNKEVPRPYIFEPPLDSKREFRAGEDLVFHLVLIGKAIDYLPYFIYTVRELGNIGVTPRRHKYELTTMYAVDELKERSEKIYSSEDEMIYNQILPITFKDCAERTGFDKKRVIIKFITPTRIKYQSKYLFDNLPFPTLIQSLTLRINALSIFHCNGEWDESLRDLRKTAEVVKIAESSLRKKSVRRYSSRQRKQDTLSGFIGDVVYEGDLMEFLPLLVLGQFIHVGSDCVFGCGKYVLEASRYR